MKVTTRNKSIIRALNKGGSPRDVAAKYNLSVARVYQIRLGCVAAPIVVPVVEPVIETVVAVDANAVQVGGDHYKQQDIQPWDAIHAWGLGYFSGNVIKYVARHQHKGGVQDLKKAQHYLTKLIEMMEMSK
jgi:hypothetical protein